MRQLIRKTTGNNKGMALILAIFAMMLTVAIAVEVAYQAHVEYVTAANTLNRLKAHYAAKAGVELSLFRILLYKKAVSQFGDQLKKSVGIAILDPIWQFPFEWPPNTIAAVSAAAKDEVDTILKESAFDGQYVAQIEGEGGKIDINDLGSPYEATALAVRTQLLEIFRRKNEDDSDFADRYRSFDFEELLNDIADWVDTDGDSRASGGPESLRYEQPDGTDIKLPPNQAFKTLDELHMVRGMNDEIFNLIKDKITVFGVKGININQAGPDILKSIDPQMTDEVVQEVINRRSDMNKGGPFRDNDDFFGFLESQGVRTDSLRKQQMPFIYDAEYNFRIISVGQAVNARKTITVITYDVDGLTNRYVELLESEAKKDGNDGSGSGGSGTSGGDKTGDDKKPDDKSDGGGAAPPAKKIPVGRPTIVFWQEV